MKRKHRMGKLLVLGLFLLPGAAIGGIVAATSHTPANPNTASGQKQIASEAATQAAVDYKEGRFCEAAEAEPSNGEYQDACTIEKNKKARGEEAGRESEATREVLRKAEEGK